MIEHTDDTATCPACAPEVNGGRDLRADAAPVPLPAPTAESETCQHAYDHGGKCLYSRGMHHKIDHLHEFAPAPAQGDSGLPYTMTRPVTIDEGDEWTPPLEPRNQPVMDAFAAAVDGAHGPGACVPIETFEGLSEELDVVRRESVPLAQVERLLAAIDGMADTNNEYEFFRRVQNVIKLAAAVAATRTGETP